MLQTQQIWKRAMLAEMSVDACKAMHVGLISNEAGAWGLTLKICAGDGCGGLAQGQHQVQEERGVPRHYGAGPMAATS